MVTREVRRKEMAAGEGTGKAGRPPLTGKSRTANNIALGTRMTNSYHVHKQAPAGGVAAAALQGVRSQARRHLPLPPRGGHWKPGAVLGLAR
jgi:hypothetical protein